MDNTNWLENRLQETLHFTIWYIITSARDTQQFAYAQDSQGHAS